MSWIRQRFIELFVKRFANHRYWLCLFGLLFLHCILLRHALTAFPTVDEVGHLPAGISHWRYGRFDLYRVNPPLVRILTCSLSSWEPLPRFNWTRYSIATGKRPEFDIGSETLLSDKLSFSTHFFYPRCVAIFLSFVGVIVLFEWCWRTLGAKVAIICGILWVSSPSILACSATIVPDMGACAFGLLACYLSWRYACDPSVSAAIIAGVAGGLALLSKLTWLTGVASLPALTAVILIVLNAHFPSRKLWLRAIDFAIFGFFATLTLNIGYLFEGSFQSLGKFEFCSEMLGGPGCNAVVHGNRFANTWLANVVVPVPRNYLLGIDFLRYEVEERKWSFLNGQWKYGSWPHYYLLTIFYKTPEPTLILASIGLCTLFIGIRRKLLGAPSIAMFLYLAIPSGVCFASVSVQGGFNHHHRYVLMTYPLIFALAAFTSSTAAAGILRLRLPSSHLRGLSVTMPLIYSLVILSMYSSLYVHPYYTSYFNTSSGGPQNGWKLLSFSNVDWGQDILEVEKWLRENPDRRPVVMDLDYFGINGDLFDISTRLPPNKPEGSSIDEIRKSVSETQWWIISVKRLYNLPDHPGLEYLQQVQPTERIAYAYHVYRIDPLPIVNGPNTSDVEDSLP